MIRIKYMVVSDYVVSWEVDTTAHGFSLDSSSMCDIEVKVKLN